MLHSTKGNSRCLPCPPLLNAALSIGQMYETEYLWPRHGVLSASAETERSCLDRNEDVQIRTTGEGAHAGARAVRSSSTGRTHKKLQVLRHSHPSQHIHSDYHIILATSFHRFSHSLSALSVSFAMPLRYLFGAAALFGTALAHPSTSKHHPHPAQILSSRDVCSGNTASSRSEWCDYSIDTDYAAGKSGIFVPRLR